MQIESRTCQACLSNYAEMQPFLCKITQFLSYKHQNHQKIIQYSDNLIIKHHSALFWGQKLGTLQNYIQSSEQATSISTLFAKILAQSK